MSTSTFTKLLFIYFNYFHSVAPSPIFNFPVSISNPGSP
nr:MAG TPA: hypothetical protein [Caudoviricetes sp.]